MKKHRGELTRGGRELTRGRGKVEKHSWKVKKHGGKLTRGGGRVEKHSWKVKKGRLADEKTEMELKNDGWDERV